MFKEEFLRSDVLKHLYKIIPWLEPIDDVDEAVVQDFVLDENVLFNELHRLKMFAPATFGKGTKLVSCFIHMVDGQQGARIPTILLLHNAQDRSDILVFHKVHGKWMNNPFAFSSTAKGNGCIDLLGEASRFPQYLAEMFTALYQVAINIMVREHKISVAERQIPPFVAGNA